MRTPTPRHDHPNGHGHALSTLMVAGHYPRPQYACLSHDPERRCPDCWVRAKLQAAVA